MKKSLLFILFVFTFSFSYAQTGILKQTETESDTAKIDFTSEVLEADPEFGEGVQRLTGNVIMTHDSVTMTCDTAFLNQVENNFIGKGNVHLNQGDTIDIWADELFYNGNLKLGNFRRNVIMKKDTMTLTTDSLDFDLNENRGFYEYWAKSGNGQDTLVSKIGIFDSNKDEFYFRTSVEIRSPEQTIYSDTLIYNTNTKISTFLGPTEILGDSNYIYCENGWYNHDFDVAQFNKNAFLTNGSNTIKGDSLYYNRTEGFGKCYENVTVVDTAQQIIISGKYGILDENTEFSLVADSALLKHIIEKDTLYLHADTLISFADTAYYYSDSTHVLETRKIIAKDSVITLTDTIFSLNDTLITTRDSSFHFIDTLVTSRDTLITTLDSTVFYKHVRAYNKVKMFKSDFQAKSDSLTYTTLDSVFRIFKSPILWSDSLQVTADSILVFMRNDEIEHAEILGAAFIIMQESDTEYNQVKGLNIFSYFKNDELYKIVVKSDAQSIFYVKDDEELMGINKSESTDMEILRNNGEIEFVKWFQKTTGALYPDNKISESEKTFPDFIWRDSEKPKKWQDIFIWEKSQKPETETESENSLESDSDTKKDKPDNRIRR